MDTRSIVREIVLPASPERIFSLLIRPSAIREWWQASQAIVLPARGGFWAAAWGEDEDEPDYVAAATLHVFDPPRRLVLSDYRYHAKTGPLPFEADFTTEFRIEEQGHESKLIVTQNGFPTEATADEYYRGCEQGWEVTLKGILAYLESAKEKS
ncbi:MAG: SRPBCC domain-containing protein [Calditrichaeota bacterium]|nr:MAG: SRPBCC domain-containing protein [Calditrichota bacterium]